MFRHGLRIRTLQVLRLALLAILCSSSASFTNLFPSPQVLMPNLVPGTKTGALYCETYLPPRKPHLHLPSPLRRNSLILLETSAHDACGYGEVAVVSVLDENVDVSYCEFAGSRAGVVAAPRGSCRGICETYVRPAAFQAKAIVQDW
jgi:hypothetical protein